MVLYQNQARILAHITRDKIGLEAYDHEFWVAKEVNGTFSELSGLHSDGNSTVGYGSISIGPRGQAAVVTDRAVMGRMAGSCGPGQSGRVGCG